MNKRRNDILLILALLAAAGAVWLVTSLCRAPGAYVVVTVDGKETGRYALAQDGTYTLETAWGTNVLTVSGGRACISEADCPDKVCVRTGWISKSGQTIVCLPHRLAAEVVGGEELGYDAAA